VLPVSAPEVLAIYYESRGTALVTLHNFSDRSQLVEMQVPEAANSKLVNLREREVIEAQDAGGHRVALGPFGIQWLRVGEVDGALNRQPF
jgi:hypothetical protein